MLRRPAAWRRASGSAPVAVAVLCAVLSWGVVGELAAQSAGGEPDEIILPPIVLELDEPAADRVEAGLPPALEILPPQRALRLPSAGELQVELPTIGGPAGAPGLVSEPARVERNLVAEAELAVGTLARLDSSLSVLGTGPGADFQVVFAHTARDGVRAVLPAGAGADTARDELTGSVRFGGETSTVDAAAQVVTEERGLQGQSSAYRSVVRQEVAGDLGIELPVGSRGKFRAELVAGDVVATLTSASPETYSELRLEPAIELTWQGGAVTLGTDLRYLGRADQDAQLRHRLELGVQGGLELGAAMVLGLDAAWSWGELGHRFPATLEITGTPGPTFSYRLAGGYEIREHGLTELTRDLPYAAPATLVDDAGWFGEGQVQLGIGGLSLIGGLRFAQENAALLPAGSAAGDGLHPVTQGALLALTPNAGVRIELGAGAPATVDLRVDARGEVLERKPLAPAVTAGLALEVASQARTLGIVLNSALDYVPEIGWQVPEVGIEGFWLIGLATVSAELVDLLEPLFAPRRDWGSYLRPGFGAALGLRLAL